MKNPFTAPRWNPYIAGALVGLLAVASVVLSTAVLEKPKYLGASTTFVRAVGLAEQAVAPDHVANNAYYQAKKVKVDWQMLLLVGIFAGALLSSRLGKTYQSESTPPIWRDRFGDRPTIRAGGAVLAGAILMFGARLAGGCPSGHGLSGNMQMAVSGLVALVFFMAAGILTARLIYGGKS